MEIPTQKSEGTKIGLSLVVDVPSGTTVQTPGAGQTGHKVTSAAGEAKGEMVFNNKATVGDSGQCDMNVRARAPRSCVLGATLPARIRPLFRLTSPPRTVTKLSRVCVCVCCVVVPGWRADAGDQSERTRRYRQLSAQRCRGWKLPQVHLGPYL